MIRVPSTFFNIANRYMVDDESMRRPHWERAAGGHELIWLTPDAVDRIIRTTEEEGNPLTDDEIQLLNASAAVIVSHGLYHLDGSPREPEAEYYDTKEEADEAWVTLARMMAPAPPSESEEDED